MPFKGHCLADTPISKDYEGHFALVIHFDLRLSPYWLLGGALVLSVKYWRISRMIQFTAKQD